MSEPVTVDRPYGHLVAKTAKYPKKVIEEEIPGIHERLKIGRMWRDADAKNVHIASHLRPDDTSPTVEDTSTTHSSPTMKTNRPKRVTKKRATLLH
ncbi:hypothetical protein LXL04_007391 [Taraxacum kok-saghyz]